MERSKPSEPNPAASSRLLVVDDNPNNRNMLWRRLTRRGYEVEVAESGAEALEKINQAHYDLVLLDQIMPGMSGLDLLRLLRATHSQSELPVIMVTPVDNRQSVVDAFGQGANDHVSKPIDLPVVAARIQAQLERSRADRDIQAVDPLTQIYNRTFFLSRLSDALESQAAGRVAVLLIDLDNFKTFNDGFGHAAGDRILIETARRFQAALSDEAALFDRGVSRMPVLARVGGAEFALLLDSVAHMQDAESVAHMMLACLQPPFEIPEARWSVPPVSGSQISMSASMGIAVSARGKGTAAELLRDASLARACAQEQGHDSERRRCEIFDPSMRLRAQGRMALAMDLRHAVERGELVVFYQPQVHLVTRTVVGFEALLRWRHPECGLVSPADFIPLAEETGLIIPLGSWILRQACLQIKTWQTKFPCEPPLTMNVNLSVKQLADPQLVQSLAKMLEETGVQPESLRLELTESTLVAQIESARETLARLQALRVGLDLDDFGTGYSSLRYLSTLHFDSLKIDRSFVSRLASDPESAAIVEVILNLARTLHMTVVAEGIETEEQLKRLIDLGCVVGQGFLFSRPVPALEAERLLGAAVAA